MQLQNKQNVEGATGGGRYHCLHSDCVQDVNTMLMTREPVSFSCLVMLREIVWEGLHMLSGMNELLECLMSNETDENVLIVLFGSVSDEAECSEKYLGTWLAPRGRLFN
jgi:hypothetical protein